MPFLVLDTFDTDLWPVKCSSEPAKLKRDSKSSQLVNLSPRPSPVLGSTLKIKALAKKILNSSGTVLQDTVGGSDAMGVSTRLLARLVPATWLARF